MTLFSSLLFVTGTDTGVGKTVVTALLALRLRQLGFSCGVLKPFASGCLGQDGILVSEDVEFLREALELAEPDQQIGPIRLEAPLSPLIAAREAGISTQNWPQQATAALREMQSRYEVVVVEGAGGILAPLWESGGKIGTNLDLINLWRAPTVVVARRTLGTINHTFLTLQTPLRAPARFAGLIFNDATPAPDETVAQTSVQFLREQTTVPFWGEVPFLPQRDAQTLNRIAVTLEVDGFAPGRN